MSEVGLSSRWPELDGAPGSALRWRHLQAPLAGEVLEAVAAVELGASPVVAEPCLLPWRCLALVPEAEALLSGLVVTPRFGLGGA